MLIYPLFESVDSVNYLIQHDVVKLFQSYIILLWSMEPLHLRILIHMLIRLLLLELVPLTYVNKMTLLLA